MKRIGRDETGPRHGPGCESLSQSAKRPNNSRDGTSLAMTHAARADLHSRAARILARSIFSHRLTDPDVHVVEEALRLLFEREAAFHERQASKLRHGAHPLELLAAAFEPRAAV